MSEKNNKKYNLSLTSKQINYIVETLLYAGSINIGADWSEEDSANIVDLAVKIKQKTSGVTLDLKNLTVYKGIDLEDNVIETIEDNFDIDQFTVKEFETV